MAMGPKLLLVGVAAFVAGLAAGLALRRTSDATSIPTAGTRAAAPGVEAAPVVRPPEATGLQRSIDVQRERIRELEGRLLELERRAGGVRSKEEKLAAAKEILDMFVRLSQGSADSDELLKAMSRLNELDGDTASYFIEKYRTTPKEHSFTPEMALLLMLASGGPDVEAFVLSKLKDPATSSSERRELLSGLAGENGFYSASRLPVGPELAQLAQRLVVSGDSDDRQGGAGLLGSVDSPASRSILQQLAMTDADGDVRVTAVRALGYTGDRTTLQLLETYALPVQNANEGELKALKQAVEIARERLRKKFPD
jgi:hypothetical protein